MSLFPKRATVAAKINCLTILLILATSLGLTLFHVSRERDGSRKDLLQRGKSMVSMVSLNSEYDLYVEDREALQKLVESTFTEESVAYLVIYGSQGQELAARIRDGGTLPSWSPDQYSDEVPKAGTILDGSGREVTEVGAAVFSKTNDDNSGLFPENAGEISAQRLGVVRLGLSQEILERRLRQSLLSSLIFTTLLVLVGSVLTIVMTRRMTAPLKQMRRVADEIAEGEGDLTRSFQVLSRDEIGDLAESFNRFLQRLQEMVRRTRAVAYDLGRAMEKTRRSSTEVGAGVSAQAQALERSLAALGEIDEEARGVVSSTGSLVLSIEESSSTTLELEATIEEIATQMERLFGTVEGVSRAIGEISVSAQQITGNIGVVVESTEITVSSMTQMDSAIKSIQENAERANHLSEEAARDAQAGMETVTATIEGIRRISETVEQAGGAMRDLGTKSGEIGKILTVIDEVSDQTSLLALNAAIIAAQAGEHGRAFSVVAEEIRELAERTAIATREIAAIIGSVRKGTEEAARAMENGRSRVQEEVARSQEAGIALDKIRKSTIQAAEQVCGIVRATQEQAKGSQQITSSINQVATMLDQISAAMAQQGKGHAHLTRAAEAMREIAANVKMSTGEQAKGSHQISASIEKIRTMIDHIDSASRRQGTRTEQLVATTRELRTISDNNAARSVELDEVVTTLSGQTAALEEEVGSFKA